MNKSEENKPKDEKGKNIEKNITNIKKVRIKLIFKMKKVKKMTIKLNLKKLNFKMVKLHKLMIQNLTKVIKMKLCLLKKISLKIILKMRFHLQVKKRILKKN